MTKSEFKVDRENLEVIQTRIFDAPRELVFKAISDPVLVAKWWGYDQYVTVIDKMEFKVGGAWRYVQQGKAGDEHAFNGEYKEIIPNEKISYSFEYEPLRGHILVETITFEDLNGQTKLTSRSKFANIEDLDGMVASGMEVGAIAGWERLAVVVSTLN